MDMKHLRSIILHLAVTMLLTCGFVKAADKWDPLHVQARFHGADNGPTGFVGGLPCGSNLR
jgi:hypothetical protein